MAEHLGPYARAILRVRITFPAAYPLLPPLFTFATDIFHPLLTPLTTYTYTTGASDNDTVSATDEERLPPGGFSLRHGFPQWFGRSRMGAAVSETKHDQISEEKTPDQGVNEAHRLPTGSDPVQHASESSRGLSSRFSRSPGDSIAAPRSEASAGREKPLSMVNVLRYIRAAFDDETVLDSIPLAAAGNPSAWHAWRSHRSKKASLVPPLQENTSDVSDSEEDSAADSDVSRGAADDTPTESVRRPGQWNWEGVWEERVRKGIEGSLAEPVLYGHVGGSDDLIHFKNVDDTEIDKMKGNVFRHATINTEI